jgi:alpha-beta hydrolase superfamily lysophospholipase
LPSASSNPEETVSPSLRRNRRWALIGAAALAVCLLFAGAAASWHFSSGVVLPDHSSWPENVTVEEVAHGRVVLERMEETDRPGFYGLAWQGGHAIAGPILADNEDTVTRRLVKVDGYLVPGMEVALDPHVYSGNPLTARGLRFAPVPIDGELGPMPAWLIPGRSQIWAIVVHGINSAPKIGLRIAPALHQAGLSSLLITYREDLNAPESPDGYHHMGLTEWRDLEAAARYALSHGARRLVLIGYSMGGAIVTQFMQKSPFADSVDALVLDAPVLDWKETIEFNATEMGVPGFSAVPVEWAVGMRIDADWDSLDAQGHTEDFQLPILLFHGEEDDIVPIATSDEFADELSSWVTYHQVPEAGHTQAWNVNPQLYEERVEDFISATVGVETELKPQRKRARPSGRARSKEPAATYSPRRLPSKYHRR